MMAGEVDWKLENAGLKRLCRGYSGAASKYCQREWSNKRHFNSGSSQLYHFSLDPISRIHPLNMASVLPLHNSRMARNFELFRPGTTIKFWRSFGGYRLLLECRKRAPKFGLNRHNWTATSTAFKHSTISTKKLKFIEVPWRDEKASQQQQYQQQRFNEFNTFFKTPGTPISSIAFPSPLMDSFSSSSSSNLSLHFSGSAHARNGFSARPCQRLQFWVVSDKPLHQFAASVSASTFTPSSNDAVCDWIQPTLPHFSSAVPSAIATRRRWSLQRK